MRRSRGDFIREQGFPARDSNEHLYSALMFQPRTVGVLAVIGVVLQSPWFFLTLSSILWWGALVPTRNAFDAIYNAVVAKPGGLTQLGAAPAPRRFAMGMAATVSLIIGAALLIGATTAAWILEGLFIVAVLEVILFRFCSGAYLYHLLRLPSSTM